MIIQLPRNKTFPPDKLSYRIDIYNPAKKMHNKSIFIHCDIFIF